jgi:hypothetical protein
MVRAWTGQLHHVVDSNITRDARRATHINVIISLTLAFGLFTTITMDSSIAYEKEQVRLRIGADVSVLGSYLVGHEPGYNLTVVNEIGAIEGVMNYSRFVWFYVMGDVYSQSMPTLVIDAASYKQIAHPSDYWFEGADARVLDALSKNGTVLVDKDYARRTGILVGDIIPFHYGTFDSDLHGCSGDPAPLSKRV